MARYGEEHKRHSREKILRSAGELFRRKGYLGTGVDAVMSRAGLTAGAFYAHFDSKSELLAESLAQVGRASREMLAAGLEGRTSREWLDTVVRRYLSRSHRDRPACPFPALVGELGRADAKSRQVFEDYLGKIMAEWGDKAPATGELAASDRVLATLCLMVGGMAAARAVRSAALSDRILRACRKLALEGVNHHDQSANAK